jgi:hypothetical protein
MDTAYQISEHMVRFYLAAQGRNHAWSTAYELANEAKISQRTGRGYCLRFVKAGLFERSEVFPGYRYRLAPATEQCDRDFLQRLEQAVDVCAVRAAA